MAACGIVTAIDRDEVATAGAGSKSGLLAKALSDGKLIIVVTIQTFPFALEEIRESKGLEGQGASRSSPTRPTPRRPAPTANKLKEVLSAEELEAIEDGGEIDVEAILAAEMTNRALERRTSPTSPSPPRPKAKTLELFGRKRRRWAARAVPRLHDEAGDRGGLHPRRAARLPDLRHRFPDRPERRSGDARSSTRRRPPGADAVGASSTRPTSARRCRSSSSTSATTSPAPARRATPRRWS